MRRASQDYAYMALPPPALVYWAGTPPHSVFLTPTSLPWRAWWPGVAEPDALPAVPLPMHRQASSGDEALKGWGFVLLTQQVRGAFPC